jgi:hypothetical protein
MPLEFLRILHPDPKGPDIEAEEMKDGRGEEIPNEKVLEVLLEAHARCLRDRAPFGRSKDRDRQIYALAIYHAVILFSIKKAGATAIGSWRWLRDRGLKWSSERLRKMPEVLIWLCKADTRALESWNPGPLCKKALTREREREDKLSNVGTVGS